MSVVEEAYEIAKAAYTEGLASIGPEAVGFRGLPVSQEFLLAGYGLLQIAFGVGERGREILPETGTETYASIVQDSMQDLDVNSPYSGVAARNRLLKDAMAEGLATLEAVA